MKDFYLKFADEAEAVSILYTITPEVLDDEGNVTQQASTQPNYRNIDVLGELYDPIPDPMPEGYSPVALPGWHVNVRLIDGEDGTALEPFSVIPTNPRRVWA